MNPKDLKIGDRIRILRLPPKYAHPEYKVPPETLSLYELLISSGHSLEVIDHLGDGYPITSYDDNRDPDNSQGHALMIDEDDDGCWELIDQPQK